jgi:hypothetical protein
VAKDRVRWFEVAALFVISKIWKQHKCPWSDAWRNCGTHLMEYYLALIKKEILPFMN